MALSLLTLMLGGALAQKPRATKRDAITIIRGLGFGLEMKRGYKKLFQVMHILTLVGWLMASFYLI